MGSEKMAFGADRQVLLVLVITVEFLSVLFCAKCLFLLRELNHMEDVETLLQRNSFFFLAVGIQYFCFYLPVNELIFFD